MQDGHMMKVFWHVYNLQVVSILFIQGLSLLRPMYYEYPDMYDEAYTFDHQVMCHAMSYNH